MKTKASVIRSTAFAALLTTIVSAHHSTANFDYTKEITVTGTVKEFRWANPHTWLYVVATQADGSTQLWGFESGTPNVSARMGWRRDSLKPGDHVVITACPTRSGDASGTLKTARLDDGTMLYGVAYSFSESVKAKASQGSKP